MPITPTSEKARRFRRLHERDGVFVIPNPWNAGSARLLEGLGFQALATTSSAFAMTLGRLDGQVTLDEKVEHCRAICAVTDIPVSADLENGFAHAPEGAARAIARVAEVGVVGASIEDWSGERIYDLAHSVERVEAAARVAKSLPIPFTFTARAENLIRGRHDLDDTIERLVAFERAGADVLYAPGLRDLEQVKAVTSAVTKPVNVLAPMVAKATVDSLAAAGAKRLSVGGALGFASLSLLLRAGQEMLEKGTFTWTADAPPSSELQRFLGENR